MEVGRIIQLIEHCAHQVLPDLRERPLTPDDSLEALGANSMDRAEIVMLVLESLLLDIPRAQTTGPTNIRELAELLHDKLKLR